MYTKKELVEKLRKNNFDTTPQILESYLRLWKIDPIYEDESGEEYFDELTLVKLNQGLMLKEQGISNEEILPVIERSNISKNPARSLNRKKEVLNTEDRMEKITVDVTNQTLAMLADSIAQRISCEIADRFNEANNTGVTLDMGKLKRDNEILAAQVYRLLSENKKLVEKLNRISRQETGFKHLFGSVYIKHE